MKVASNFSYSIDTNYIQHDMLRGNVQQYSVVDCFFFVSSHSTQRKIIAINGRGVSLTVLNLSRDDSFHVITVPEKLVHPYLVHFPDAVHAGLVLAQRAEL